MAKRKTRKRSAPTAQPRIRSKTVLIVSLLLSLVAAGGALAGWNKIWPSAPKKDSNVSGQIAPSSFTPTSPAKEYIYAGGRLIATEEPQGSSQAPSITGIFPASAIQGAPSINIKITGSNLSNTSSVNFTSTGITVNSFSYSQESSAIIANLSISETAPTGNRNLSVTTPAGTSNLVPFEVKTLSVPTPSIQSISHESVQVGSMGSFTLEVNGSGFISTSEVRINDSPRTVTHTSSNLLKATILSTDIQTTGIKWITVFNPSPNGGKLSNAKPLNVTASQAHSISSILPNVVTAGTTFTLTINGTNLNLNSVAHVDDTPYLTNYNSLENNLTIQILGSAIPNQGTKRIRVYNPGFGGGFSNTVFLTIDPANTGTGTGLIAEYFNNLDLAGIPMVTRVDPWVNFNWGLGSPASGISVDQFSVRWSGQIQPPYTGDYTFYVFSDDGVRLWIDGQRIINEWENQYGPEEMSPPIPLIAGHRYEIKVEYFENWAGAEIYLKWSSTQGGVSKQTIPQSQLYPTVNGTGLKGEYFTGMNLGQTPVFQRTDATVDFNWVDGSPGAGIPADQFSVRWTGRVKPPADGNYTFYVLTDDGVRLWVNNQLLVNQWVNQWNQEHSNTIPLNGGQFYDIRMEFYEDGLGAEAHLSWSGGGIQKQIIPTNRLFLPASSPAPIYEGYLDWADCSTIFGWAADRMQLNTSINVSIYDGATLLATVPANQYRQDIAQHLGDNGLHGFTYAVPASLKDGQPHTIWVKYAGTSINLGETPKSIQCTGASVPSAPTGLTAAVVSASQVNLAWTDTSNDENGFRVERKIGVGGNYQPLATPGPGATTYSDTGLSTSTTYYYQVRASNNAGNSAPSNEVSVTIPGGPGGLAAPTNLTATVVSAYKITLSWSDNSSNESGFKVERKVPGNDFMVVATVPTGSTSYSNERLNGSTTYVYRVRAYNGGGFSEYSEEATATTSNGPAAQCANVNSFSGVGGVSGSYGYIEGAGSTARWRSPSAGAVGIDPVSRMTAMFVADTENHSIRMVYLEGPAEGHSTLIAGSGIAGYWDGDGDPYQARYNYPQGITALKNAAGVVDALLVADTDNNVIRQLLPPLGKTRWRPAAFSGTGVAGYADGLAAASQYNSPQGMSVGADGLIYLADTYNGAVRVLDREGNSTTLYKAPLHGVEIGPVGITTSGVSDRVYITDLNSQSILKVTAGTLERIAGSGNSGYSNGVDTEASFDSPYHLVWAPNGGNGVLYVSDLNNQRVRLIEIAGKEVSSYAGSGNAGYNNAVCNSAYFNSPSGIVLGPANEIYVIEKGNNSIRKIQ
jgi:PA14 domain-containing protein/fibronectin type III domain protein